MAWTNGDLKIFAAGLAIGGKWNGGNGGSGNDIDMSMLENYIMSDNVYRYRGTSTNDIDTALIENWVLGGVEVLE